MPIRRFQGRTLEEALLRARESAGESALVLSQEPGSDGNISISVSVPDAEPVAATLVPAARRAAIGKPHWPSSAPHEPGLAELRARLERSGASWGLIETLEKSLAASGARGIHVLDAAARELEGLVRIHPSPKRGDKPCAIAFIGTPGAGKSTCALKLARRLAQAGRRVRLIALSDQPGPAPVPLEQRGLELGLRVERLAPGAQLAPSSSAAGATDLVIFDTEGLAPRDEVGLARLARRLSELERDFALERYLAVPADSCARSLASAIDGFAALAPCAAVLTRLDLASEPAVALELVAQRALPLALLGHSRDPRDGISRAGSGSAADLLLRGRVA